MSRQPVRSAYVLLATLTAGCLATAAHAAAFYVDGSVRYQYPSPTQPTILDSYQRDLGVSVGDSAHHDDVGIKDQHGEADSLAEQFGLHAHTYVEIIHQVTQPPSPFGDPMHYTAYANARVTYTDVLISSITSATTVQAPLNFHIKGAQGLAYYVPTTGFATSISSAQMTVQVPGDSDGGFVTQQSLMGAAPTITNSGMLATYFGNGETNVATRPFTLPVNTPFTVVVYLSLSSDVQVDFTNSFIAGANTDFSGTLTFATDRPVFTLPAGYSVNSAQAGIVSNQFALPTPEPGTLGVLLVGVLALIPRRRRQRD